MNLVAWHGILRKENGMAIRDTLTFRRNFQSRVQLHGRALQLFVDPTLEWHWELEAIIVIDEVLGSWHLHEAASSKMEIAQ